MKKAKTRYEELEENVAKADERIGELQQRMNETGVSREKLEGQINVLREQIHTAQQNEEHVKSRIEALKQTWSVSADPVKNIAANRQNWKKNPGDGAEKGNFDGTSGESAKRNDRYGAADRRWKGRDFTSVECPCFYESRAAASENDAGAGFYSPGAVK